MYWLEIFADIMAGKHKEEIKRLHSEANELLAITVASINTARKNRK